MALLGQAEGLPEYRQGLGGLITIGVFVLVLLILLVWWLRRG